MKKILSLFIVTSICLSFGFTNRKVNTSTDVLEVFNRTFSNAKDAKWYTSENQSTVIFINNDIRTSITYDKNARFLSSRRYYGENNLPFNILLKIKDKYRDKKIGIVTEVIEKGDVIYSVNVEDEQN